MTSPWVEAWVKAELEQAFRNPDQIRAHIKARRAHGPDAHLATEQAALSAQRAKVQGQINRFQSDLLSEEDDRLRAFLRETLKLLLAQAETLDERLTQLAVQADADHAALEHLDAFATYAHRVVQHLHEFGEREWQDVLNALDVNVVGSGIDWRLDWAWPGTADGDERKWAATENGILPNACKGPAHRSPERRWCCRRTPR